MNKIFVNFKYNMREQIIKSIWYLSIYTLIIAIIYVALIMTRIFSESGGGLIYRIWGATIFLFAIFIQFKDDFNFMLTLSMTRWEVFLGKMATAFSFGFIFGLLILLERIIVDRLNVVFNFQNITDPFHFWSPYQTDNLFVMFIYFFLLSLCFSLVGIFLGTLFYRFGNKFVLAFWLIFSAIPTVFLPFFLWVQYKRGILGENMSALGSYLTNFNLLGASASLFVITLLIAGLTWLNIRRLSQN